MSMKLLIAGVVLTVLAIKTEKHNRLELQNESGQATTLEAGGMHDPSVVKRGVALIGTVFKGGLAKATEQSLLNSQNTLALLEPRINTAAGERGAQAKTLVKEARAAMDNAHKKLEEGKTFHALDYAMQASSRAGHLREQFERR